MPVRGSPSCRSGSFFFMSLVGGKHGLRVNKMGASIRYTPYHRRPERVRGAEDHTGSWWPVWNPQPLPLLRRPDG